MTSKKLHLYLTFGASAIDLHVGVYEAVSPTPADAARARLFNHIVRQNAWTKDVDVYDHAWDMSEPREDG